MSDDYQSIPVAAARAAVQESGQLEGVEGPLFLADNESDWLPYYISRYDPTAHPLMAKVIVTRRGQKPREVVISWDEYAAELEIDDPEWLEKRKQKPMAIFGAEVERHGYRVVFADILAPLLAAARPPARPSALPDDDPWEPEPSSWFDDVAEADAVALNKLYEEARKAGLLVSIEGLQQAFTDRMLELSSVPKPAAPSPAKVAELAKLGASLPERSPQGSGGRRRRGKR